MLVTGHTGFKGSWLLAWLADLGAEVTGFALAPDARPSLFDAMALERVCAHHLGDVRDLDSLTRVVRDSAPEIVLHLAAQPLVRRSYRQPVETFTTNVLGTAHLLEACRTAGSVRAVVSVTTDKVYANTAAAEGCREGDSLGGDDPYSASKAAAEIVTHCWRTSFLAGAGIAVASARAGNVIGGGDFSEDRILPDAVRAFTAGKPLEVRNPAAVRPWQLVVEPLAGYLLLAESLCADPDGFAEGWNFGPDPSQIVTVGAIAEQFCAAWGDGARWQPSGGPPGPKEAALLLLDPSKARQRLGWHPRFAVAEALAHTARWYQAMLAGADAGTLRGLARATIAACQAR